MALHAPTYMSSKKAEATQWHERSALLGLTLSSTFGHKDEKLQIRLCCPLQCFRLPVAQAPVGRVQSSLICGAPRHDLQREHALLAELPRGLRRRQRDTEHRPHDATVRQDLRGIGTGVLT